MEHERITLSIDTFATMHGESRAHAYELSRTGELPDLPPGRRVVIPRKALEEYVEAPTAAPSTETEAFYALVRRWSAWRNTYMYRPQARFHDAETA